MCPECGAAATPETRRRAANQARMRAEVGRVSLKLIAMQAGGGLAGAVVAVVLGQDWWEAWPVAIATVAVSLAGVVVGALPCLLVRPGFRGLHFALWQRNAFVLHLPWMSIPAFAVVLAPLAWGMSGGGGGEASVLILSLALAVVWFVLAVMALGWWCTRWERDSQDVGEWQTGPADLGVLMAFVQMIISGIFGFAGGVAAAEGVASMLAASRF